MSQVTTAIIPTAGWGTRRLPVTKTIEKTMLPIGNRPIVDYSVRDVIAAGVKDIYIVVSDIESSQIKQYYSDNIALNEYLVQHGKQDKLALTQTVPENVNIHFVAQGYEGKYGTALPVAAAVEQCGINEPALVFMGDDFIWNPNGPTAGQSLLQTTPTQTDSAILGVEIAREEISRYGVLRVSSDGQFQGITEKPQPAEAPSNLINVSKYLMSAQLLQEVVNYVHTHDFGPQDQEYMIVDPINTYLAKGGIMRVASTSGEYLDGGSLEGWLHANNVVCGNK